MIPHLMSSPPRSNDSGGTKPVAAEPTIEGGSSRYSAALGAGTGRHLCRGEAAGDRRLDARLTGLLNGEVSTVHIVTGRLLPAIEEATGAFDSWR